MRILAVCAAAYDGSASKFAGAAILVESFTVIALLHWLVSTLFLFVAEWLQSRTGHVQEDSPMIVR